MRIGNIGALGVAAALVSLAAASSAGPSPNLVSLAKPAGQVATNNSMDITVQGSGKCLTHTKIIDPNGKVTEYPNQQLDGINLPYKTVVVPKIAGLHTVIVYTEASALTPSCPGGQEISTPLFVFNEPKCPPHWQQYEFNKNTGTITCAPTEPQIVCKGKNQSFYTPSNEACEAGCQAVVY